jgi:hypothetical protein
MKFLLVIILLFFALTAFSQNTQDVILLKSGTIIKGKIIESNIPNDLKILTGSGSTLIIPFSEIKSIESVQGKQFFTPSSENAIQMKKGVQLQTGLGLSLGEDLGFDFLFNLGYRFNPHFSASVASGYYLYDERTSVIPAALRLDYSILSSGKTPYMSLSGGYGFYLVEEDRWIHNAKGGANFSVRIGRKNILSERVAFFIEGGFQRQKVSWQTNDWGGGIRETHRNINRLAVSTGFIF